MKVRPLLAVIILCLLGMAVSAAFYAVGQKRAATVFAAELDINSLQRLVQRQQTFLVYFYGRSCEDCAVTEPYFVQALTKAQEEGWWDIAVYKCEREANATVRSLYGVESTPTYIYFWHGEIYAVSDAIYPNMEEYYNFLAGLPEQAR